jgi:hypothetical protein
MFPKGRALKEAWIKSHSGSAMQKGKSSLKTDSENVVVLEGKVNG